MKIECHIDGIKYLLALVPIIIVATFVGIFFMPIARFIDWRNERKRHKIGSTKASMKYHHKKHKEVFNKK